MSLSNFLDEDDEVKGTMFVDFSQIILGTILKTYDEEDIIDTNVVRHITLSCLLYSVTKYKAQYPNIVIAIDNAKNGYWRRHKYYFYKKNRDKQKAKTSWDWDSIYESINTVADEIKEHLPYKTINLPHTEADDTIGVLVKMIAESSPSTPLLILSSDGDFTQLQKYKNVKQWSTINAKWVVPKHGTYLKDLITKIVKGDPKDTVSNIKMSADFLHAKLDGERQKSISTKLMESIFELKDHESIKASLTPEEKVRYDENRELIDFEMIPDNISRAIINEYNAVVVPPRRKIYPYFVKNRLVKLLDKVSEF